MSNRMLKKAMNRIGEFHNKELEELIKKQIAEADMFEAILDGARTGHCVVSETGSVKYANSTFFRLIPTNKAIKSRYEGKKVYELITDKEILTYLKTLKLSSSSDEPKEFYFQRGSEIMTVKVFYRYIVTEEDNYLDIYAQDITEDKRKETRLRRSESLASMTTMAAGIAHEIKNPLAAMQIHLQLMRKAFSKKGSLTQEEVERYLSVLEEEITRLNGIAVDFLFAVRPMDVNLKLASVAPLISELCDFVEPELNEHNIKLEKKIQDFLPKLEIDENYIKQAILNIIKNAENAMEDGGTLTVIVKNDGNNVLIEIRDTGCGIDQETLGKIFEPYFTTKAQGTGLGLTVVYKVIKEHKGDISVESTVGKGTAFIIKLPVPQTERIQISDAGGEEWQQS